VFGPGLPMHFLTSPDRQRAGFARSRCVRLVPRIIKPCCSLFPVSFPTLCCLCRASSALPSSCCQARQKPAARSHGAYGSRADRLTAGHGKGSGCPSCPCAVLSSPWRRFRPGPQSSSLSPPLNAPLPRPQSRLRGWCPVRPRVPQARYGRCGARGDRTRGVSSVLLPAAPCGRAGVTRRQADWTAAPSLDSVRHDETTHGVKSVGLIHHAVGSPGQRPPNLRAGFACRLALHEARTHGHPSILYSVLYYSPSAASRSVLDH
jgi:hypothetical protein